MSDTHYIGPTLEDRLQAEIADLKRELVAARKALDELHSAGDELCSYADYFPAIKGWRICEEKHRAATDAATATP